MKGKESQNEEVANLSSAGTKGLLPWLKRQGKSKGRHKG